MRSRLVEFGDEEAIASLCGRRSLFGSDGGEGRSRLVKFGDEEAIAFLFWGGDRFLFEMRYPCDRGW